MERLIDVLVEQWVYDVEVLSQRWVILTVVPAMVYMVFMMLKWMILTCPIWIPSVIIASVFKSKD